MKNFDATTNDGGLLHWRLEQAFKNDPLISMLSEPVRTGLAAAFHDACVMNDRVVLRVRVDNITYVMRNILRRAPLGWVGDEFKQHVIAVTVAALLPEGEK